MGFQFDGFSAPNGTYVPDEVFDILAPELTEAELRVLLYVIRRTFGFKKNTDDISLKQMTEGIQKRDGTVLDKGTGMSKSANWRGIKGLLEKGVIISQRNSSSDKGDLPTSYSLRFKSARGSRNSDPSGGSSTDESSDKEQQVGEQTLGVSAANAPVFSKRTPPCFPEEHPRVLEENTQETVWQKTDDNPSNIRKQHAAENQTATPKPAQNPAVRRAPVKNESTAFEPVAAIFQRARPAVLAAPASPPAISPDEARDAIREYLKDIAPRFNDQAPLESSVSRAYNLYEAANLSLSAFLSALLEVSSSVKERASKVKNRAAGGKATMPYYFACLADRLGLRRFKPGNGSGQSVVPARTHAAQASREERAQSSPLRTSSPRGEQGGNTPPPHTHSFTHPTAHAGFVQSGQSSVEARSASATSP